MLACIGQLGCPRETPSVPDGTGPFQDEAGFFAAWSVARGIGIFKTY